MRSLKTVAALAPLAGLALILAAPRAAMAQASSCGWYADTAIKQQQQNELRKCGFAGPEWSADRQAHLTWCGDAEPRQLEGPGPEPRAQARRLQTLIESGPTARSSPDKPHLLLLLAVGR